ncbi:MAG: protein phosphatase 2C domain-containing protein [Pseudomonadota bacterium]
MSCDPVFRWTSAARSDVGLMRSRNEDAVLEQAARGLWAVADGMGGHAFGHVASKMVTDALESLPQPADLERALALTCEQLNAANDRLRTEAALRRVPVMGSTVAVLLVRGAQAACLWAGDSRVYLYRKARLQQLTRDHSQAEELKAAGQAPGVASNLITRAAGAADTLELDQVRLAVRDGDLFLICSDGLSNPVDEAGIAAALQTGDCQRAADTLIAAALANGGRDNISVVVVRADDVDADKTMLNPAL